jgi:site-specific recombinase XerD
MEAGGGGIMSAIGFPALVQGFFTDRLLRQQRASSNTIAAYRDTFRLLFRFVVPRLASSPTKIATAKLDPRLIGEFLDHLERERGNSVRTRNMRLAAIRSFFRYVSLCEPAHALLCQRIGALPAKRYERRPVDFLDQSECEALIAAADPTTSIGRRDRTLLLVAVQTGLRVSELVHLRREDVVLGPGAHVRCQGKGRKERCTPLRGDAASMLVSWLRERTGRPEEPVFTTVAGRALSRDAIEALVSKYAARAADICPSLGRKRVTPHVLRHTAAMSLLQNGVDRSIIALWLGHESIESTEMYLHADMRMKESALARTGPLAVKPKRYRPTETLLAFLEAL